MSSIPCTIRQVPIKAPTKDGLVYLKAGTILSFNFHISRSQRQRPKDLPVSPGLPLRAGAFTTTQNLLQAPRPSVHLESLKLRVLESSSHGYGQLPSGSQMLGSEQGILKSYGSKV